MWVQGALKTFILIWAAWLALAQPGLPACWMAPRPCEAHVHFGDGHAGQPHSHDYLLDLSRAQAGQGLPVQVVPAALLLALLFSTGLFRSLAGLPLFRQQRVWLPEIPPPRTSLCS